MQHGFPHSSSAPPAFMPQPAMMQMAPSVAYASSGYAPVGHGAVPPAHPMGDRAMPSSGPAVGLLTATAAVPVVLFGLGFAGVFVPYGTWIRAGLALVAMIVTLVWLAGAFGALRGRAKYGPGMAVGGWFIPIANLLLPALVLRDGWRASRGQGGGLVWAWMVVWWLAIATSVIEGLGLNFYAEIGGPTQVWLESLDTQLLTMHVSIQTVALLYGIVSVALGAAAYGLLALIVRRIGEPSGA